MRKTLALAFAIFWAALASLPAQEYSSVKIQGKAAVQYAVNFVAGKYKIGSSSPIPETVKGYLTSTEEEGGWGKCTSNGTVSFSYYDSSGTLTKETRDFVVKTEPQKTGQIKIVDIQIK